MHVIELEDKGFKVKVIEDSISPQDHRLTTLQLRYPRFIHAEAKTHRLMRIGSEEYEFMQDLGLMNDPALSRNAMSSRAVPVAKMIEQVRTDPAMPIHWGKNQPGMQARQECNELVNMQTFSPAVGRMVPGHFFRENAWREAAHMMANVAEAFNAAGYAKQVVNRILEPWQWMHTVVTATEWDNFFALRCHPDAMPEMEHLAVMMRSAMAVSKPVPLAPGQWHLPYVLAKERIDWLAELLVKLSTARCARVSFLTHDGAVPVVPKDMELYDRLVGSVPIHASPTEHQATPDEWGQRFKGDVAGWMRPGLHGNLKGWRQHRKMIEHGAPFDETPIATAEA